MYNLKTVDEVCNNFLKNADEELKVAKMYGDINEALAENDSSKVKYLIQKSEEHIKASVPEEVTIENTSLYVNLAEYDGVLKTVDITVRNKYSNPYAFKFKKQLVASEGFDEALYDFLKCVYLELVRDALINVNIDIVNTKLAEICEKAGNNFKVKVISPMIGEGKKISNITDDCIEYVADDTRILSLEDILVFCEPNEFISEEVINEGMEAAVSRFAQAQTTPQFVGLNEPLIGTLCDIGRFKPFTLIKKVYSKNVEKWCNKKLSESESMLTYYLDAVKGIFSVIALSGKEKEVVLKPFNIETLEVVDEDVLANL